MEESKRGLRQRGVTPAMSRSSTERIGQGFLEHFGRIKLESGKITPPKYDATKSGNDFDIKPMHIQEAERYAQDTEQRNDLVRWMKWVVTLWLFFVLLFTITNRVWCIGLSENVLITLLATTTVNVLGLSKIILSGLFDKKK